MRAEKNNSTSCHDTCVCRGQLKCDGTRAETRFRLSAKRTSPFKSGGASVQSTTVSRGVRISGSNAGYTMFRSSVKGTGYPLHHCIRQFPLHFPLPCVTVCHHIETRLYTPKRTEKQLLALGWTSHVRFAALCAACTTPSSYAVDRGDPLAGGKLITSIQLMPRLGMCGFICGFFNNAASNGGVITTERTYNDVEGSGSGLIWGYIPEPA